MCPDLLKTATQQIFLDSATKCSLQVPDFIWNPQSTSQVWLCKRQNGFITNTVSSVLLWQFSFTKTLVLRFTWRHRIFKRPWCLLKIYPHESQDELKTPLLTCCQLDRVFHFANRVFWISTLYRSDITMTSVTKLFRIRKRHFSGDF